jgi:PAS domain S-box-containing protein
MDNTIQSVLNSLDTPIAVLDQAGTILSINRSWEQLARQTDAPCLLRAGVGTNYLVSSDQSDEAQQAHQGIAGVLQGSLDRFAMEYIWQGPAEQRWLRLRVAPLEGPQQGALVVYEDITEHKRTELALQRREECSSSVIQSSQESAERRRAERALQQQTTFVHLLQAVAVAANEARSLENALQQAINQICTFIGWPVGHVYLAAKNDQQTLLSTNLWHLADRDRFATFRTITEALSVAAREELPGQVMESGKPAWITDITATRNGPRTQLISNIGVHAGFAFPVLAGAEVAAVLEFFSDQAIEPDAALLEIVSHIGTQLGRVVERSRAESALRESEERFRILFEYSPDAILLIDPHDQQLPWPIIDCNEIACRMNGYTRAELIGQPVDILNLSPGTPQEQAEYMERLRRDGPLHYEVLHRRKDGTLIPIEVVSSIISVAGRELILGIDRDISERKQAEEAQHTAEAKYRTLVEQIPAIIYTAGINSSSSTRYVSPQIETILGFTPEEWLADPELWLEMVHPDDRERVLTDVVRTQESDTPVPSEYRTFTRDRQIVWLQDAARIVRDEAGRPLFMQGITLDITARKQAEEALRRSEQLHHEILQQREAYFRALIEHSTDAVALFGVDGRVQYGSPATTSVLGYTIEEFVGRNAFEFIHADDQAEVAQKLEQIVASPNAAVQVEARVRHADGTWRHLEGTFTNLLADPAVGAIVNNYRDITERKRMEAALADERALLARRIDERTADLSAANAELARAARLKDEFLASMSHELRTPLNAVLGLSEALHEEIYGPLNAQQRKSLSSIEESGRHLLELINDILDLAKIGTGTFELEIGPISITAICQASLRLIKQDAHKKQLSVAITIDPAVSTLQADSRRLKQILINLLSNAVKFTPQGGAIGLEVVGDPEEQVARLTVWDTGIGIAREDMGRLFQPFVQLDSRLARQYNGTGLGLALVYRMVEMHGGSIAVESAPGSGSRFTISLPWVAPDDQSMAEVIAQPLDLPITIRKVLLIEDSPTAAAQLVRYLDELDIMTVTHPHGQNAVALALAEQPDLIVLDIMLPDTSGWDVLKRLKAEPGTSEMWFLIVSVLDDRAYGLSLGAHGYLTKPFTRHDVHQVLSQLSAVQQPQPGAPAQEREPSASQTTILLAEDNEANIATLQDYLSARGYRVIVARNGAEAVARTGEREPALIVMDIQMPGTDGLEAIRQIRTHDDYAHIPIIALTALAMPGDRERCLAAGADEYLSKPVSLKGLARSIRAQLSRHTLMENQE